MIVTIYFTPNLHRAKKIELFSKICGFFNHLFEDIHFLKRSEE